MIFSLRHLLRRLAFATFCAATAACFVEVDSGGPLYVDPPTAPGAGSSPVSTILVEVDTDKTMEASPGQGVGVFVEYASGGTWNVWWTCDTAITRKACAFEVAASVAEGSIRDVTSTGFGAEDRLSSSSKGVTATTYSTTTTKGFTFATDPGAVITLEATMGGLKDGALFFFVQDGKVNGGFTGKLSNPIRVQGKTP
jgi:hypothetical protein